MNFYLRPENARARAAAMWEACRQFLELGKSVRVTVEEAKPRRSVEQNDMLQVLCGKLSEQVDWYGNRLSKDDWRHMFVAAYRKEMRVVPGINGGFVVLGGSSAKLKVGECADVIEMIYQFGAERGVDFGD